MRTPLNAVINLTKAAKRMEHAPSKIAEYLDKIERSSSHLLQLVNDILEMSRLAQGKAELNLQRMDLHDYLEECFSPFRIQADMEGKTFRTTWNGPWYFLPSSRNFSHQIISALAGTFLILRPSTR